MSPPTFVPASTATTAPVPSTTRSSRSPRITKINNRIPRTSPEGKQNLEAEHVAVPYHTTGEIIHVKGRVVNKVARCRRGGRRDIYTWLNRREKGLVFIIIICISGRELRGVSLGYGSSYR